MLHEQKITFIGGGVMCEAIVKGLLAAHVVPAACITISEPLAARRTELSQRHDVTVMTDNADAARSCDVLVLAVKPQMAADVLRDIKATLPPQALVISIMAGVTLATMTAAVGSQQPIVRVMPNTPAAIGMGASGWHANPGVNTEQKAHTSAILSAMGISTEFPHEHYIDMVTGVSGSGPAFVFLFAEAYIDAAVRIGIPRPQAELLCMQTLKGSIALMEQTKTHPAVLKGQVTSAGGTTAAGLHALESGALRATVEKAVEAAWRRSVELGKH